MRGDKAPPPTAKDPALSEYALKLSDEELARYRFMAESACAIEREMWASSGIVGGAVVADVGCGPGSVSAVIAELVGPGGRVLAVDREVETVETARALVARTRRGNVDVMVGEAHDTGIPPESVDVVMIRHVLAHNGPYEQMIVDHAATLVRPGGCVYLADLYARAFAVRPSDPDLDDLDDRYQEWHHQRGNDLATGLRLGELLQAAGLEVVDHQGRYQIFTPPPGFRSPAWAARDALVTAGLATADDIERWRSAFERLDAADRQPTVFVPLFFAYGRRAA